jgi:hypothetical protein
MGEYVHGSIDNRIWVVWKTDDSTDYNGAIIQVSYSENGSSTTIEKLTSGQKE